MRVDRAALDACAEGLQQVLAAPADDDRGPPGPWDPAPLTDDPGSLERALATAVVLDTVNFGSGWHPVLAKPPGRSGATTIASGVRRWLDDGETHARRLAGCDPATLAEACGQSLDQPDQAELMRALADALGELAVLLERDYGGRVLPLVEDAGGSAARFASLLAQLPSYADTSGHDGRPVALFKRAQLAAADVARASAGTGPGAFDDVDELTAFADNLVPHVLRVDGVLRVDPGLAARIDRGELLVHGSTEEVEIRALGVVAVELLREALAERGTDVSAPTLDQVLWTRGAGRRYKAVPRHRARCRAY